MPDPRQPILLVDDDEDDFLITRGLFEEIEGCPYVLEWAPGYEEGLKAALEERHLAYLVDYRLGVETGVDLIRVLKRQGFRRPVIVLTGVADRRVDLEAMAAGAEDFLDKATLDPRILERSVRYAVERHRAEERIEASNRAREEMARAVAMRDEFLLVASHELRTPLTGLTLYLETLERDLAQDPAPARPVLAAKVDRALRQTRRLSTLVKELLEASRITAGRLRLDRREMDLAELVRDVVGRLSGQAQAAGSELVTAIRGPVRGVWDRGRLLEVMASLVSNAIKYGRGKPIQVTLQAVDGEALMVVSDRGIGISLADQARIFGRFERAASVRHYGGLGLGLFIANQIVQAHGGRIEVRSRAGEGSDFRVTLPGVTSASVELRPNP